jgi:spore maturation protein SpmB
MFLVLNASGLTVIPISIIADRATLGALNPTSIFIPTLIATFCSTVAGLIYISIKQKINLFDPVLIAYFLGLTSFILLGVWYFASLSPQDLQQQSTLFTSIIIVSIIISFLVLGLVRRIPLFETFVEGAKEGFEIAIKIIPFLIAILVGIGMFRASGALNYLVTGIAWFFGLFNINTDFAEALPVAFLKPLSGQAARAMMIEVSKNTAGGPDSFVANLAAIFRGCAETTFYILALYFGSVNIRKTRYALTGGLVADVAGVVAGIFVGYLFFH